MRQKYGLIDGDNLHTMTIQETGGTRKTIEAGAERIKEMLPLANQAKRETVPASELMVALQCGGSDGYSGITANPALGLAVDTLVRHGGTGVLAETPEIYGAEHLLTRRARSKEVGEKLVGMVSKTDMDRISFVIDSEEKVNTQVYNNLSIEQIMTEQLDVVQSSDEIRSAAQMLSTGNYHALPVMNGEKLEGIVTSTDVIDYLLEQY